MSGDTVISLAEWKSLYKDIADTAGSLKSYQTECTNMKRMIEQIESTVKTENEKLSCSIIQTQKDNEKALEKITETFTKALSDMNTRVTTLENAKGKSLSGYLMQVLNLPHLGYSPTLERY
jgi:DNA anti-recombination protein RmuC